MSLSDPVSGRELAAFVSAVETGSVQGAADALMLTQSAATKRLQALERRLGQPLLSRSRTGVFPTAAGRRLYPEAKEALRALGRVEGCLGGGASAPPLRLAASHTIGEFLLPAWLAGFRGAGHAVSAHVEIVNSAGVLTAIRDGRAEVAFVEGPEVPADLDRLLLLRDEIVVVVAPGHRWASSAEVPAAALIDEPFFSREARSGTRAIAADRLRAAGVRLHPLLEVASTQSLKRAVLQGGFTLLSRLAIDAELRDGSLAALSVVDVDLRRDLLAVRAGGGTRSPAASTWWGWLRTGAELEGRGA